MRKENLAEPLAENTGQINNNDIRLPFYFLFIL
jgi:hypothetical protein